VWYEVPDTYSEEFFIPFPKHHGIIVVDIQDDSINIEKNRNLGRGVDQRPFGFKSLPEGFFHPFSLSDVVGDTDKPGDAALRTDPPFCGQPVDTPVWPDDAVLVIEPRAIAKGSHPCINQLLEVLGMDIVHEILLPVEGNVRGESEDPVELRSGHPAPVPPGDPHPRCRGIEGELQVVFALPERHLHFFVLPPQFLEFIPERGSPFLDQVFDLCRCQKGCPGSGSLISLGL